MKKRIGAILLILCLLVGLLPTTVLAGGGAAMFFIGHDFRDPEDEVCTAAGDEILLPGTHVVSVWENDFVEIDIGNDNIYEIRTPFKDFIAGDSNWSIRWSVNINGQPEEVASGQVTSISVDCPTLEPGETSYELYVYATLTATYQGTKYEVTGSTRLFIQDPIWKLPEGEQRPVYVVDRSQLDSNVLPLERPDTLMKHTSDTPAGTKVPMPENFTVEYEVYDGDQQVTVNDAALNDPHPGYYRVYTKIKDQNNEPVVSYNQDYFVTDGDVIARQSLAGNVIWTLTKDGTLTFQGNGEVPSASSASQRDWERFVLDYRNYNDPDYQITQVVAEEGITALGSYVLTAGTRKTLTRVTLPSTLKKLEDSVFQGYDITSATYAGEDWSSVTVGDGNESLNNLLAADGITLWVENNRLYGRFTDPGSSEFGSYRLYFYDSTQNPTPEHYIYVSMDRPNTSIDLTDMRGYGRLDHFAVFAVDAPPTQGGQPLYDVALAKPIQFLPDSVDFPFETVTASVEENPSETESATYPYIVNFSQLTADYRYELSTQDHQYIWSFEGNRLRANDEVFGACTLAALFASDTQDSFLILTSKEYPITISQETQPALPEQEISWTTHDSAITWTYGAVEYVQNAAYNDTQDGGELTYSSSDPSVATVDGDGKATIVGAGTTTITATAAAVPGQYTETSASYTLTIRKAPLTITANDAAITYGQAPVHAGWTGTGYVYGQDASVVTGTPVYSYTYEQYGEVGAYHIQISGLSAKNYEIAYTPGTLTVEKATEYTITLNNLEQLADHVSPVTAQISPQDDTADLSVEYQVDGVWTATPPQQAGDYPVRAALTSSENITAQADAYTTAVLAVRSGSTVSVGDSSVVIDTTVTDGKAEITVSDEQLQEILEKADGTVSVDLSGVKDTQELVLPGNLVNGLSSNGKTDSLTVSTEDASLTLSAPVLDTVANAVTSGQDQVAVRLTSVEENDLSQKQQEALDSISQDAVIVEVSLVVTHEDQSTTELHQLGGDVDVSVRYDGEVPPGKYVVVCYLSDDGNVTYIRAAYDETTKQISFTTNHFSHYALFVSGEPVVVVNGGSGSGLYQVGDTVTVKADSKRGYTFHHWQVVPSYVELANANTAVTTFPMPNEAVELTAVYTQDSTGGNSGSSTGGSSHSGDYLVAVEKSANGKVTVSPTWADRGDTVTITVEPDDGYELDGLTVTEKDGDTVKLTDKGNGKYTFTMPGSRVEVEATFQRILAESPNPFVDVSGRDYYYDAVLWAAEHGVTGGTSATTFGPNIGVTRAQMMTFLWRAYGSPKMTGSNPFSDVSAGDYYYDAVLWAVANGVTSGTSTAAFSPDAPVTRAQAVTFLWRAAGSPAVSGRSFDDVAGNAYYADAVTWAVANGITSGTGQDTFSPEVVVSRSQAVTFLWRAMAD